MLTREENELLTQTGKDTPMGAMLRQYWAPILRGEQLAAGGKPLRITLFRERYVAFRAADGRIGVLEEACAHRCASLALARNEGDGLRCLFHGWKFDVDGCTVDVPTEPPERRAAFAAKVPRHGYPVHEAGGLIWVFFGTGAPPKFPDFEFCHLPADHVHIRVASLPVNWVQAMDAIINSAHLGILHSSSVQLAFTESAKVQQSACTVNTWPRIKYTLTPYGFREAALRDQPDGTVDTRIREFVAPWHAFLPLNPSAYRQLVTTVPIDDTHCIQFFIIYMSQRPLTKKDIDAAWFCTHHDQNNIAVGYGSAENMWNQDRAAMEGGHFTGLTQRHVFYEDFAILESMGPIVDRTQEYLCQTDATVILARRQLMKSALAFARDGTPPWGLDQADTIDFSRIRGIAVTLPEGQGWESVNAFAV